MNIFLCICFLFFAILQGCNEKSSTNLNEDDFKKYVNSNTQEPEKTIRNSDLLQDETMKNQEYHPLVNMAF